MIDKNYIKHIDKVPLSNNTVSRRILTLSNFGETELTRRAKMASIFGLQMDESTDVAGLAVSLVFVRYNYESRIEEDLLICKPLENLGTTGEAIFNVIDSFMEKNEISWKYCSSICSDGAAAMVGYISDCVARI